MIKPMKRGEFLKWMEGRACAPAQEHFIRSRQSPQKWAEGVWRKAKKQLKEVEALGETNVWMDSPYEDGRWRVELGWLNWYLEEVDGGSGSTPNKMRRVFKNKSVSGLLARAAKSVRSSIEPVRGCGCSECTRILNVL